MRRDQVLKICLNHVLTSEIEYLSKDDRTWLFSAPDYSEGELNYWQFCLRFKTAEIAQEFKKSVDDALHKSLQTSGKIWISSFKINNINVLLCGTCVAFLALTAIHLLGKRSH